MRRWIAFYREWILFAFRIVIIGGLKITNRNGGFSVRQNKIFGRKVG